MHSKKTLLTKPKTSDNVFTCHRERTNFNIEKNAYKKKQKNRHRKNFPNI